MGTLLNNNDAANSSELHFFFSHLRVLFIFALKALKQSMHNRTIMLQRMQVNYNFFSFSHLRLSDLFSL